MITHGVLPILLEYMQRFDENSSYAIDCMASILRLSSDPIRDWISDNVSLPQLIVQLDVANISSLESTVTLFQALMRCCGVRFGEHLVPIMDKIGTVESLAPETLRRILYFICESSSDPQFVDSVFQTCVWGWVMLIFRSADEFAAVLPLSLHTLMTILRTAKREISVKEGDDYTVYANELSHIACEMHFPFLRRYLAKCTDEKYRTLTLNLIIWSLRCSSELLQDRDIQAILTQAVRYLSIGTFNGKRAALDLCLFAIESGTPENCRNLWEIGLLNELVQVLTWDYDEVLIVRIVDSITTLLYKLENSVHNGKVREDLIDVGLIDELNELIELDPPIGIVQKAEQLLQMVERTENEMTW
jgi:hypothetical protein